MTTLNNTVLYIQHLTHYYKDAIVLKDIHLSIQKGEFVSIVGASGVGKTTLFHLIANILPIQEGEIIYSDASLENQKVNYMFQKDLLLPHKTIIENIMLPLQLQNIDKETAYKKAEQMLVDFQLHGVKTEFPKALSGGMRQRVALLRTVMMNQPLSLLDEPFSALDALTKEQVQNWYMNVHKRLNLTTLMITHDIEEAVRLSDRVYVLSGRPGEIVDEVHIVLRENEDSDVQRLQYKRRILEKLAL